MSAPSTRRCARPGCERKHHAKGHCRRCYLKQFKAGLIPRTYVYVPAGPVIERIAEHRRRGQLVTDLAAASGVDYSSLLHMSGNTFVTTRTATRVFAVPLPPTGIGTIRRLQALARIGYTWKAITTEADVSLHALKSCVYRGRFPARMSIPIAAVFERWSVTPGPSYLTRKRGERLGWPAPGAWTGIDIDDPTTEADLGPATDTDPYDEVEVARYMAGQRKLADLRTAEVRVRARSSAARDEAIRRFTLAGQSIWWIKEQVKASDRTVIRVRAALAAEQETTERQQNTPEAPTPTRNEEMGVAS